MKYNPNKIVIFDWGGIVESHRKGENNYLKIIVNIISSFNTKIDKDEIISLWKKCLYDENGRSISACNNSKDIQRWFDRIKEIYDLKCNFEEFYNVYKLKFEDIDYYKNVVKLEHETKNRCKIGILSNLTLLDKERINKQLDTSKFDYVWLSCDLGEVKPSDKIYEIVENDCKIIPQNILFIDDRDDNIIVAKKRSWNVYKGLGYEIDNIRNAINEFLNKN